jgi:hypothetical protein
VSEPIPSDVPEPEPPSPAVEAAPLAEPAATAAPAPVQLGGSLKRFTGRFATVYTTLGLIGAAAVAGLIVLVIRPGYHPGESWSSWKPSAGSSQKVTG